ncbi:integrin beta tail domain protein [Ancylostoma duodenale]|uniref:Integrin beta n=1 Tax=Ancylostoma duodenale TaxID=51022 RepID=A0A0C2CWA3_9BILA|nr:integrin beta tail domain protein [Ancylostoma duodenale]
MFREMLGNIILSLLVGATLAAEVSDWKTGDVTGEVVEGRKDFPCYSLSRDNYTCSACIQLHDSCAWCGAPLFDAKKQYARCDNRARLLEHGCPESYIEDPQTILEVEKDEPLSDKGQVENEDDAVQLKPQEMFVEIRPKSRVRFNVTYRQAVDYPVDLYYLMDLSYSMKDDKQKLSELGDLLAVRMRNITKNFRLGFGSFIDKKLMPFIDPRIEKQKSPCAEPCAEPYGFKHQMTLTTNTEKFKAEVDKAEISGNLDAPEGGFDAVVQALAEMLGNIVLSLLVSATLAAEVSDWKTGDVTGEVVEGRKDFPCYSLSRDNYTCSACIQLHDSCAWCGAPLFDAKKQYARCDNRARLLEHGCPESYIEDPQTILEVEKDEPLSDKGQVENEDDAVQLKPQEMFVEIRPKSRVRFNVTYRQAVDYPVDLYYLMDLSYSMKDDKQKLSELGDLLAVRMRNITKNFRLGFGSFIDKKLMPFIDPRIEKQKSPCAEPCAEPYGFKHQMTLTTNTEKFKAEVDKAEISGNLDAPEGGFDAVVQALACNSKIGWRERARKMVVFSTDAGFHFAGDGRLAGVVEPNDGECHLDRDGYYTETLNQDYPSIALLHQMIKDRKANIIFAVTKGNHELYTQLSESLPDVSSSVGILETDSRNIVDLIEGEYLKISEKIIMVDNANASDGLKITYRSMCLDGTTLRDTNVCEGIRVGDEVQFEVTLEATHCVEKRDFVLRIGPSGLDETLIVNVKVLCDCDCEQEDRIVENAEECHGGDMVCGVCRCKGGNVGRYCECNRPGMSTAALNEKCKRTNESAICEGRGVCNCGRCECNPRQNPEEQISGEFCECDNFNCPRHDRKICAEHGECNCGQCICAPGWTGRACECPISQDSCMSANGKICNGKGECICGRCRCFDGPDGNRYSGAKCEICPTCPTKCIEYKPCVMCQQWGTGPYDEERCAECPFKVIPVEELPELNETTACQFVDPADDCTFYYLYYYDEATDNATVWVREHKDCPPPVPVLAIVLGVIAGIVILGLILLLVWKLLTVLHDRAEYAKFNNERLMAKWDTNENPIYKQATTTFRNPVYAGNKNKGL